MDNGSIYNCCLVGRPMKLTCLLQGMSPNKRVITVASQSMAGLIGVPLRDAIAVFIALHTPVQPALDI